MVERGNLPPSRLIDGRAIPGASACPLYYPPGGRSAVGPGPSDGLLSILWRSRWIVLICALASLGAGWVYISAATPLYTATARLYLNCENITISQSRVPEMASRTDKYLQTQAERLGSRPILVAALEKLTDPPLRTFQDSGDPIAYLREHLTVVVGKKDEIVTVSLDAPDPDEAAQIVNTVVGAYMKSRQEAKRQNVAELQTGLNTVLESLRRDLQSKGDEMRKFQAEEMPVTRGSEEGGGVLQSLIECRSAYEQAVDATVRAKQHWEAVQKLAANPTALAQYLQAVGRFNEYAAGSPEQRSLEARATALELQRKRLLETLTPDHPRVVSVADEMERVRQKIAARNELFANAVIAAAEQQYAQTQTMEEQKARLYEEQGENLQRSSTERSSYQQLQAEMLRLQMSAQTMEGELDKIRKIEGNEVGQMSIERLEEAQPAAAASWPQKPKILVMALMLGLCLGGGIGLTRSSFDQTLRSVDEIVLALGLPVLGTVPAMSRRQKPRVRGQIVSLQPDSPAAEAYRTVRTAVFFGAAEKQAKTFLVTSPGVGDGKSTLVSNLGIAMANTGQKVLILDANFRTATQHLIFEVDHDAGPMSPVLGGKLKLTATHVEGLSLLLAGEGVANPAELLNSRTFAHLLAKLAERYDRVLVDAPPVVEVADAQILGALCDYAVLVLRADRSTFRMARRALQMLQSVGADLLGAVVNEAKGSAGRDGYYERYRVSRAGPRNGSNHKPRTRNADPGAHRRAAHTGSRPEA
jgi:succinoglycan biosynthesis transport protein ExoP